MDGLAPEWRFNEPAKTRMSIISLDLRLPNKFIPSLIITAFHSLSEVFVICLYTRKLTFTINKYS